MAQFINGKVKLNNGQLIAPQQGAWYDGQQYWGGTLSTPGQINSLSDQVGAGQNVSKEVVNQTNPNNWDWLQQQKQQQTQNVQPMAQPTVGGASQLAGNGGLATNAMVAPQQTQTPDLEAVYNKMYEDAGIKALEDSIKTQRDAYEKAKLQNNDNPYLSESMRVGKLRRLDEQYNDKVKGLLDQVAMKKADVQTKLDLHLKQLDLNAQATRDAWDRFNTLLKMGALDNADGQSIASITSQTGIPSSMILSAIKTRKDNSKGDPYIVKSESADGTVRVTMIDKKSGDIIKQSSLGKIGKGRAGTSTIKPGSTAYKAQANSEIAQYLYQNVNSYGHVAPAVWQKALASWLQFGVGTRDQFIQNYKQLTDPNRGDFSKQSGYGFNRDNYDFTL